MTNSTVERELKAHWERLSIEQQRLVAEYARTLAEEPVRGVKGRELLQLVKVISPDDLTDLSQAIEEGCEQVDHHEW